MWRDESLQLSLAVKCSALAHVRQAPTAPSRAKLDGKGLHFGALQPRGVFRHRPLTLKQNKMLKKDCDNVKLALKIANDFKQTNRICL